MIKEETLKILREMEQLHEERHEHFKAILFNKLANESERCLLAIRAAIQELETKNNSSDFPPSRSAKNYARDFLLNHMGSAREYDVKSLASEFDEYLSNKDSIINEFRRELEKVKQERDYLRSELETANRMCDIRLGVQQSLGQELNKARKVIETARALLEDDGLTQWNDLKYALDDLDRG